MITNELCAACIRLNNGACTKDQVPPMEDGICRFFIEKEKCLSQIAPPKARR